MTKSLGYIALLFGRFWPLLQQWNKWPKIDEKFRLYSLTFLVVFDQFFNNEISGQKWTKSYKAIALLFCHFWPLFQQWNKWPKMVEKLRLYNLSFLFLWPLLRKRKKWAKSRRKVNSIWPYFFVVFGRFFENGKRGQKGRKDKDT